MMTLRGAGAALLICLSSHYSVSAFLLQSVPFAKSSNAVVASTSMVPSSTQLRLFGIFNEAKKALVRSIAGDYDQTAVRRYHMHV